MTFDVRRVTSASMKPYVLRQPQNLQQSASSRSVLASLLLALASLLGAPSALALDRSLDITQYHHTAWESKDGHPADIWRCTDLSDGYLWCATGSGLFKFDGISFRPVRKLDGHDIPRSSLRAFVPTPDGFCLPIDGKLYIYTSGRLTQWLASGGPRTIDDMVSEKSGVTWLSTGNDLWRIQDGVASPVGDDWVFPFKTPGSLVMAANGTLWISNAEREGGIAYLAKGAKKFQQIRTPPSALVEGPNGRIWMSSLAGLGAVSIKGDDVPQVAWISREKFGGALLLDRDGGLWTNAMGGLAHVGRSEDLLKPGGEALLKAQVLTPLMGLSSEVAWSMNEDRDGNVWVTTKAGLDRFRQTAMTPIKLPRTHNNTAILAADDGAIWASTYPDTLMRVKGTAVEELAGIGPSTGYLYRTPSGTLWLEGDGGLVHSNDQGGFTEVPLNPDFSLVGATAGITQDRDGVMWLPLRKGLARLSKGVWSFASARDGYPQGWRGFNAFTDRSGRVWFAGANNDLLVVDAGRPTILTHQASGLDIGAPSFFYQGRSGLWIIGSEAVQLYDGHVFHTLKDKDGKPFVDTTGLVETAAGDLWLHSGYSALKVTAAELAKVLPDLRQGVDATRFNAMDGLRGRGSGARTQSSLVEASDGRLWFSTDAGLSSMDPRFVRSPKALPPVEIDVIRLDGTAIAHSSASQLPPGPGRLEITFTVPYPGGAERVRFRYRLIGQDKSWVDAGNQREASYSNLPPGSYEFHVAARDESGPWSTVDSRFEFRVLPSWYQTYWFRCLVALLGCGIGWLGYRFRVAVLTSRVRQHMAVQQIERERIARELHDTLLQGVQGVLMTLQSATAQFSSDTPQRARMERALDKADQVLAESRDRVLGLREDVYIGQGLIAALSDLIAEHCHGQGARCSMTQSGVAWELGRYAEREVYNILAEGFINALSHAKAERIDLRMDYTPSALDIELRDDGIGIPPEFSASGRSGHGGVPGMRERTRLLGATLDIRSGIDGGTVVNLRLPRSSVFSSFRRLFGRIQGLAARHS